MTTRIADTRPVIDTLARAKERFQAYVLALKRLAIHTARADKQIADIKARLAEENGPLLLAAQAMLDELSTWIQANKHLFEDPRKVKTDFGTFGLQKASEVYFLNEEVCLKALQDGGYLDCIENHPKVLKTPLRKLLESGVEIPGVMLRPGDTVVVNEDKTLIKQAVQSVLEQNGAA